MAGEAAAGLVTAAVRRSVAQILTHEPLVRLDAPLPGGDSPVHRMRVGCRRLRSDLRTFAPLLDQRWSSPLRAELRWLAGLLGGARDAEVQRARLWSTAAADPAHPLDPADVAALDRLLAARRAAAYDEVLAGLDTARYAALAERLAAASAHVPLSDAAFVPVSPAKSVRRPLRHLRRGRHGAPAARDLTASSPDVDWHGVRISAKRARYAAEAAGLRRRARVLAELQDLLGEHQDAVVAAALWQRLGREHGALAVACGRLAEREFAAARAVRTRYLRKEGTLLIAFRR
ncbi:CHAD domain-containing protein [Catellatospora sp. KI3]|uniref:CHAD domain-containing protein n=1 Tax=Catellatospora sp. KI3 TaxID=3041620 RepID=UPI002483206C|nr:CHAD domain-containing protein [Catellatospora sp. KI3]MDI1459526.1 CHAD domain-containing protein [Catellatospora sp. KI3]